MILLDNSGKKIFQKVDFYNRYKFRDSDRIRVLKFEWIDIPSDEDMRDTVELVMKVVSGFDAELSVGYCF